jgi:hypothetical protein
MQLRSGTIIDRVMTTNENVKQSFDYQKEKTQQRLKDQKNNPVSLDINNLIYTLRTYETIDKLLSCESMKDTAAYNNSNARLILVLFEKTLQLMSQLIEKTYKTASLEYTNYTKGLIVKTLYKLREVFIVIRYKLSCMEYTSDYISELLEISLEKRGKKILNTKSIQATAYYCYRHFYKSQEENCYDMSTYADGEYTEVEIYDYYFKGNTSKDVINDLFINEDYKRWFVLRESIDRYDNDAYDIFETVENQYSCRITEVKQQINFHKYELEKYERILRRE